MLNSVRELPQMRINGSLTGVSGVGTMASTDLGAPLFVCWGLLGLTFFFLTFLIVTTIRPHWAVYLADEVSGLLDRFSHRAAPPRAT